MAICKGCGNEVWEEHLHSGCVKSFEKGRKIERELIVKLLVKVNKDNFSRSVNATLVACIDTIRNMSM